MDLGGGGHFRYMPPPLLGQIWACPNRKMNMHVEHAPPFGLKKKEVCVQKCMFACDLDWKCSENGKNGTKHTKKSLFEEALFMTASHLVVLVIIYMCVLKDNKHP